MGHEVTQQELLYVCPDPEQYEERLALHGG